MTQTVGIWPKRVAPAAQIKTRVRNSLSCSLSVRFPTLSLSFLLVQQGKKLPKTGIVIHIIRRQLSNNPSSTHPPPCLNFDPMYHIYRHTPIFKAPEGYESSTSQVAKSKSKTHASISLISLLRA